MTKYQLHSLADKIYWDMTPAQQRRLWVNIVSNGLDIQERDVIDLVQRIRSLPFGIDQYREDVNLLAKVSEGYFDRGPRGGRPIIATLMNVAKFSGATTRSDTHIWYSTFPFHSQTLVDWKLSASNTYAWKSFVQFTSDDIYRGIYIARTIDEPTSAAVGLAYADGYITYSQNSSQLRLGGGRKDTGSYKLLVSKVLEQAFNFLYEFPEDIPIEHNGNRYTVPRITIGSKAISTYFINWIGFPTNEEERANFGISDRIKGLNNYELKKFLSHYASFKAVFSPKYGNTRFGGVRFTDKSKLLLEDLVELFSRVGIRDSMSIQQRSFNSYALNVSEVPTLQMLIMGLFDANEGLRDYIKRSFPDPRGWKGILALK